MSLNLTTFEAALKTIYPDEAILNLVYANYPILGLMPKDMDFRGENLKQPIIYGLPQNRSNNFTNALNGTSSSSLAAFLLTRITNYSLATIDNQTIEASETSAGAFIPALKMEVDNALQSLSNSMATQAYRSGTGSIGTIASTATINSTTVLVQLSNPDDVVNLEPEMNLAFSQNDGGTLRSSSGAFVVNIDRDAGAFLCSATIGGAAAALTSLVTSVATGDYIYQNGGDLNAAVTGLSAWLVGSNVSLSDSFFGVNRSVDTRLAGHLYNGTSVSISEAIVNAAHLIARERGRPDTCLMSFADHANLVRELMSRQQYVQHTNTQVNEPKITVAYQGVQITGPRGPINCIPDTACPVGKAFVLQMDTWKFRSIGNLARIFNRDGNVVLRSGTADAVQLRCFSYAQMSCAAPGWNAQVTLPSTSL